MRTAWTARSGVLAGGGFSVTARGSSGDGRSALCACCSPRPAVTGGMPAVAVTGGMPAVPGNTPACVSKCVRQSVCTFYPPDTLYARSLARYSLFPVIYCCLQWLPASESQLRWSPSRTRVLSTLFPSLV